jgi:endonuclease/exonuclease/phosphatase family metal-dependent hydrolase
VFDAVLASSVSEQDVVLFGDLNADCQAFNVNTPGHPLRIPRFHWVIPDSADTNVRANQDCSRDRIILLDATHDSEYVPGSAAVFHFDQAYGLSEAAAVDVSDHYPVFARFDTSAPDDD